MKLDIKEVLQHISNKDYDWFSTLSTEQQDSFEPFVLMLFLSNVNTDKEYYLEMVNQYLNVDHSKMSKDTFYRTCCAISLGKPIYCKFINPPKGTRNNQSLVTQLVSEFELDIYDDDDSKKYIVLNKDEYIIDDWLNIAKAYKWKDSEVDKLKKELKQLI